MHTQAQRWRCKTPIGVAPPTRANLSDENTHLPTVGEIMVPHPTAVPPTVPTGKVARLMASRTIGCVVVCNNGSAEGVFTERDLLRRAVGIRGWDALPVRQFMTSKPVTVGPDELLTRVVELLYQKQVRHLPVVEGGRVVGILSVHDVMRHREDYLQWLIQQQTFELQVKTTELTDRDRLMQHHLELGSRIQRRMLPQAHYDTPPLSFTVAYRPLDQVSGDYYDFAVLSPDRVGILIADASGHGIPAAFVSVVAKAVFHADGQKAQSPAAVLRTMNAHLFGLLGEERFVTMFYGIVDRQTLQLTYATAGHPPPLWYDKRTATVKTLDAQGFPLGVVAEPAFDEVSVQLAAGDRLLLYTDGVTECRNEQQEMFGQERTAALLRAYRTAPSDLLLQELNAALGHFRGPEPPSDDATCVAIEVKE